jgi:uncharacterized membrane protein
MTAQPKPSLPLGSVSAQRILLLAILLAVLATALRLAGISLESLDPDEIFSYRVVTASASQALQMIRQDLVHPPLFYYLVHVIVWIAGTSVMSLRAVSLFAGVGTVVLLVYAGALFRELRTALWVAAPLLALNNTHIFYSQQARSAALYTAILAGLLLWSWMLAGQNDRPWTFWLVGSGLMAMLIYTHYIGALYVLAVAGSSALMLKKAIRKRLYVVTTLAALTFLPWILLESSVYAHKRGLAENLAWTQNPSVYQLKLLWANYMGVPDFPGATTVVFVLGAVLIACGILYRQRTAFVNSALLTLATTAFIPPVAVFLLSQKPFALPIFGERHLLPSIVSWLLLAAYGVDRISFRLLSRRIVLGLGVLTLFSMQVTPTLAALRTMPRRLSYEEVARKVAGDLPIYTTSVYDIGNPVSFYLSGRQRVTLLSCSQRQLPEQFILMYRPEIRPEQVNFAMLIDHGWTVEAETDYTNAAHSAGYVRVVRVHRTAVLYPANMRLCP